MVEEIKKYTNMTMEVIMTFFSKIFRKERTAKVICKCGAKYKVDYSNIFNSETDEKRKLCFYTYCKVCDRITFLDESKLSKRYVKKTYKEHKWCN